MKILITIAARGGSKGVKNKNIRSLCGKPLIAHTVLQALKWGKAARVVVSTDSPDIAAAAVKAGALAPFMRPAELAGDAAGKIPVIAHAVRKCEELYGEKYDYVIDLDATAPLRKVTDIDLAFNKAVAEKKQVLFSVVPAHKSPYFNMVELDAEGIARLSKKPASPILRRQDAPAVYDMNASIYVCKRAFFETDPVTYFTENTGIYVMDRISGHDIDTEEDFRFIEYLVKEGVWGFDYE
ncbi:MAG: hypothetical protein A2270_04645 [Elusimicrobia bacterium RIFOXYA12_FULL_51_18]|nr:MAG: hypothetical protein A2270_04645 [Elusimicrobia bacterium RIFOXYA12_FULL_51_18]OGS32865.1 MAG: hypothetical protein A2218_10700 [Elusimicrobia bacterium RIFOXYA2_FULL_53_38]